MIRHIAAIVLLAAPPALAANATSPSATVRALYAAETRSLAGKADPPWRTPDRYFDTRLTALFHKDNRVADREGMGNLQFDPLCNGQDCRLTALAIAERPVRGGKAIVDVRFRNMGKPMHLVFTLTPGAAGWRIAEITSPAGDGWVLSAVLNGSDR